MIPESTSVPPRRILPYGGVLCCALLVTASEVCMKKGADQTQCAENFLSTLGIQGLSSGWVWAGILFYLLSFAFWLRVLKTLPLNVAFNLVNIEHLFVPLASYLFLGETVSLMRAVGIGIVLIGVWVIAEPFARVEGEI